MFTVSPSFSSSETLNFIWQVKSYIRCDISVQTGLAGGLAYTNNLLPAAPAGLLGLLLLFQTTRVRFVFDDKALVCDLLVLIVNSLKV